VALGFVIPAAVVQDREEPDLHLIGRFLTFEGNIRGGGKTVHVALTYLFSRPLSKVAIAAWELVRGYLI
jgi:hypothetical protein